MRLPDLSQLPDLPVRAVLGAVTDALAAHGSVVLVAPPGTGKTTLVPLALAAAVDPGRGRRSAVHRPAAPHRADHGRPRRLRGHRRRSSHPPPAIRAAAHPTWAGLWMRAATTRRITGTRSAIGSWPFGGGT